MRKYIDLLNESAAPTIVAETEVLEEGLRDQVEAIIDRVMKMFAPKHVTYEAACTAIDHVNEMTGGQSVYTKAQLMMGGKLSEEIAGTAVGVSLALSRIHALGMPITAAITATITSLMAAKMAAIVGKKRAMVMKQADSITPSKSPAPVRADDGDKSYEQILSNIAGIMKK